MDNFPTFRSYGEYSSGNYGVNSMEFSLPNGVTFYYSYTTLIAFRSSLTGLRVMKNQWSTTTGKHLNWIDGGDKKSRLEPEQFEKELQAMLKHYGMQEPERCKECGEALYGLVRVHHHTNEAGQDVTA